MLPFYGGCNMNSELQTLPKRIKYVRKRMLGMTQRELARALNTSYDSVSRYERGKNDVPSRHLLKIGELGNVSLEWLLSGKGEIVQREGSHFVAEELVSRIDQLEKRLELHQDILLKNTEPSLIEELKVKVPDFIGDFKQSITVRTDAISKVLEELELQYIKIMDDPPIGEFIFQDDRFRHVNDKFIQLMGYDKQRLLNESVWQFVHPEDLERLKPMTEKRAKGEDIPKDYKVRVFKKNGEVVEILVSVSLIDYEGRPAACGRFTILSEWKQLAKSLEALKKSLK